MNFPSPTQVRRHAFDRIARSVLILAICATPPLFSQKTVPHADSSFLKDAAEGSMDEVKLGQLAQQTSTNDHVKKFGQRMVEDHSKMGDELKALAAQKGVTLPTDISLKMKASNKLLAAKSGTSFDTSYISEMVKDHQSDIAAFEKEANNGKDEDIRAFATKNLPILREHLRLAQDVAHELGISE